MSSFFKLFANPGLVEVLSLFLLNPEEEFYQTEIANKTEHALMQVQRALKTLKELGLISSVQHGKMVYYKALRGHYAFEDLKSLFLKTVAFGETIRRELAPFQSKIHAAFIFGSVARGDESLDSDIDLFIFADLTLREFSKVLGPLSKKLGRELNPVIFSTAEFQNRISQKDHFLVELVSSPKLWIIGNEDHFNQLVKRGKVKTT